METIRQINRRTGEPLSPVTMNSASRLVDKFEVADIVSLYREQFNVDVRRFFSGIDSVGLYECNKTKYRFYYPFSIAGDALFYEQLQEAHQKQGLTYYRGWAYDHQFAYDHIASGEHVLDIGCGSGNFLEKAREKTPFVYGLEFNDMAIQACLKKGFTVQNQTIEEHARAAAEKYDVVCAFQVLEHVSNVKSFLDGAIQVLKPGGKLIIGVPNNEPFYVHYSKYDTLNLPPHHMGLWSKKAFLNLQAVFPLIFSSISYQVPVSIKVDAYHRAKYFWNIKSMIHQHTFSEKIKMFAVAPVALAASLVQYVREGKPSGHLVVSFTKN